MVDSCYSVHGPLQQTLKKSDVLVRKHTGTALLLAADDNDIFVGKVEPRRVSTNPPSISACDLFLLLRGVLAVCHGFSSLTQCL